MVLQRGAKGRPRSPYSPAFCFFSLAADDAELTIESAQVANSAPQTPGFRIHYRDGRISLDGHTNSRSQEQALSLVVSEIHSAHEPELIFKPLPSTSKAVG